MNSRLKLSMKFHVGILFLITFFSPVHMKYLTKFYGVLDAAPSSGIKETYCMVYFPDFGPVAKTESLAESHILEDSSQVNWCDDHPEIDPQNKVLLLSTDHNCSIIDQAINIQNRNGKGIFYIADEDIHVEANKSETSNVNITVGYTSKKTYKSLMGLAKPLKVTIFSPGERGFEYSLIVLFVVAIFTICAGAYLSRGERLQIMQQNKKANNQRRSSSERATNSTSEGNKSKGFSILDEQVINVPACYVFLMVFLMSGMLLLVYFFFDYLVYVMIGLFTIASIGSIFLCLDPFISKIPLNILRFDLPGCGCDLKRILLFAVALGVPIFWVINRNHQYGWILQDILGVFFSVHMLKTIRLGNMKMCALILSLLFLYDIFFVFITPFLTKKGMSIMEEVARGGNTSEMIPMVLKVVHLGYDSMSVCYTEFSILGLGDILVPGLLVCYCMWFDEFTSKKKLYFWVSIIGYGIGMICTYVGLFLMATAQPALLYLVPCCLLPPITAAYFQGELKALWTGIVDMEDNSNGVVQEASTDIVPEEENATMEVVAEDQSANEVSKATEISQDEKNCLIK